MLSGLGVGEHASRLISDGDSATSFRSNFLMAEASAILASCRANRSPMQLRGPWPKA